MITKSIAIEIAESIALAANYEISLAKADGNMSAVYAIRATAFRSVEEIWYNAIPIKTREKFNYDLTELKEFMSVILDCDIIHKSLKD